MQRQAQMEADRRCLMSHWGQRGLSQVKVELTPAFAYPVTMTQTKYNKITQVHVITHSQQF